MSWPSGSPVDRAIAAAYRDQRWTLRQCSYVYGPSVKTVAAILGRAGVPRRPPHERQAGLPGPAKLASTMRYAQRGYDGWDFCALPWGCDDSFTALAVAARVISRYGWPGPPSGDIDGGSLVGRMAIEARIWAITWILMRERDVELYIVGPRPRGDGLAPGWCAPAPAGLAALIKSRPATRIVPSRERT